MCIRLIEGNYFLALDRNANGQIDTGAELFGPSIGNGFDELMALDSDRNGWIDEGDSDWSQLRLWRPTDSAKTLKELGIGALSVANAKTPFQLKDASNNLLGLLRDSGVFLTEQGTAGLVQQVDLVV